MFEDAHYQYEKGALDPDIFAGYEKLYAAYAKAPGFQAYWNERKQTFRPEFQQLIDGYGAPIVQTWGALNQEGMHLGG